MMGIVLVVGVAGEGGGGVMKVGVGIPSFFTNLLLSFVVLMLEMLAKRNTHILSS